MFASMLLAASIVPANPTFEMEAIRNVAYYDDIDADSVRHKLDIYVPKGHRDFPVVIFWHGGGWVHGSKDQFGIYAQIAKTFCRYGIGVVCPNYRLTPDVRHPEHIRDVAKAFAWVHKNIGRYGGRSDELFISGHSAGGHLCALLASDPSYLKEQGLKLDTIRGAMPVSGLFIINHLPVFLPVFGKDMQARAMASPISHVAKGQPPYLIFFGDSDLPGCDRPGAEKFAALMKKENNSVELVEVRRNHFSILWQMTYDTDPVFQAMLSFIMADVTTRRLAENTAGPVDQFSAFLARYATRAIEKAR